MFDNLITIITTTDPRFVIGWALMFYGLGVITVALFWAREKRQMSQLAERALKTVHDVIVGDLSGLGHVIEYHETGIPTTETAFQHAHCICGETSLMYRKDDPTAERLMAQWADNHIDSLMESAGR